MCFNNVMTHMHTSLTAAPFYGDSQLKGVIHIGCTHCEENVSSVALQNQFVSIYSCDQKLRARVCKVSTVVRVCKSVQDRARPDQTCHLHSLCSKVWMECKRLYGKISIHHSHRGHPLNIL